MIGINQRIPIQILEMALIAAIRGESSSEYFASLAAIEYKGQNRIKKAVSVINRLTVKNPLWQYIKENSEAFEISLQNKSDRPILFAAIINGAYCFGLDMLSIAGKYFHAQDEISTALVKDKLAEKYGANRSLPNALYCVLPMFVEAGLIERPYAGTIKARRQSNVSDFAKDLYCKSFLLHIPNLSESDNILNNPYFEYIK